MLATDRLEQNPSEEYRASSFIVCPYQVEIVAGVPYTVTCVINEFAIEGLSVRSEQAFNIVLIDEHQSMFAHDVKSR